MRVFAPDFLAIRFQQNNGRGFVESMCARRRAAYRALSVTTAPTFRIPSIKF